MSQQRSQTIRGRLAVKLLRDYVEEQFSKRRPRLVLNEEGFHDASVDRQAGFHGGLPPFEGIPPPPYESPPPDDEEPPSYKGPCEGDDSDAPPDDKAPEAKPPAKVCIVGAGAAGIYMAWMLTYLGINHDLLEASNRIGGRVYTYSKFKKLKNDKCPHNYYDVSAMRIPDIKLNESCHQDISNVEWTDSEEEIDEGFQKLLDSGLDKNNTRDYLRTQSKMSFERVQELETLNTGRGLFDRSFIETILNYADFPADAAWFRIEGGMIKLIDGLAESIRITPRS